MSASAEETRGKIRPVTAFSPFFGCIRLLGDDMKILDAGRYYRLPPAVITVNSIGAALRRKLLELLPQRRLSALQFAANFHAGLTPLHNWRLCESRCELTGRIL